MLDKRTMQMEIHNAEIFNMQPVIPGKYNCIKKKTIRLHFLQ